MFSITHVLISLENSSILTKIQTYVYLTYYLCYDIYSNKTEVCYMAQCKYLEKETLEVLDRFCASRRNQRTAYEYMGYIRSLCEYCEKDFLALTESDVRKYFDHLQNKYTAGALSLKTVCVRLSCYRSIASFIMDSYSDTAYINPFLHIKRPAVNDDIKVLQIPSMEELDIIMQTARNYPPSFCIFALASRTALSASSILRLRLDSLKEIEGRYMLFIKSTSLDKEDLCVNLPDDVAKILLDHIASLDKSIIDESQHLFYNKHKRAMSLKNLDDLVHRVVKESGVATQYSLKDLRTRAILDYAHAGAAVEDIRNYTGLGELRLQSFYKASHIFNSCPADLVCYSLKVPEEKDRNDEAIGKQNIQ